MKSKLFKKVSAISIALCMALSASAVAIAGWTDDVYTPSFERQNSFYDWSATYGKDGYILLGDGVNGAVIYSNLYQDSAYATDASGNAITSTKGTSNKILGGLGVDNYNHYKGYYYTYAQAADTVLPIVQVNGGTSLTGNSDAVNKLVWADTAAKADLLNSTGKGGLRDDAPISTWGVSGATWSGNAGYSYWLTPAGEVINVRVHTNDNALPYTVAFTINENALDKGGIYVTVHTYNFTSGDMRLVKGLFVQNNANAIAEKVEIVQSVSVEGVGYTTFYINEVGEYSIVANDLTTKEGITGIFFDKTEPTLVQVEETFGRSTASSEWEEYYGTAGYFIAAHDGTTKGAYIGGLVDGVDGDVITACAGGEILTTAEWNGPLAGMYFAAPTWDSNGSSMNVAPYAPGTTTKTLGRVYSNSAVTDGVVTTDHRGAVGFTITEDNLARAEAVSGERAIYVTVVDPQYNTVSATTNFTSHLYYGTKYASFCRSSANNVSLSNAYEGSRYPQAPTASQTVTISSTEAVYITYKVSVAGCYGIDMVKDAGNQVGIQALFVDYVNPVDNFADKITVDLAGGSLAEGDSIPESYNLLTMTEDIVIPTPTRPGYKFAGWKVNGADAVMDYAITSANVGDIDLVATWSGVDEFVKDDTLTVSDWEGTYGNDGYVILAGTSYSFYSDMYTGHTGTELITADTAAGKYGWVYKSGTDTGIDASAPISRWGYTGGTWASYNNNTTLYIPGTTTNTNARIHNSSGHGPWSVAMMVTTSTTDPVYMTVYIPKAHSTNASYSKDYPVTLALYNCVKTGQIHATNPGYTNRVASYQITDNTGVYVTFLLRNARDYMISIEGDNVQTVKGMFGGIFFDYNLPERAKTLTVDKADGSDPTVTEFKSYSSDITLETPSRVGYTFAGWKVNGADIVENFTLDCSEATADVSVVATWTPITYAISVDLAGGDEVSIPTTYTVESDDIVLPTPTKAGYDFVGWLVNGAEDTVDSYTIASGSTGDVSLVAVWTGVTYTITYDANGGTVSSATQSVVYGEEYSLLIPTHSDPTKVFGGWRIVDGDKIASTGYWTMGDVSLEAIWNTSEVAISIDTTTQAIWEGVYGNAGYVIYAGTSNDTRYVYTKNIFAGDSEGARSQLDAWDKATNDNTKESNYHAFRVDGNDPDGTIVSQFNDQTYNVNSNTTPAAGLYLPGDYQINKYMTKAAAAAAPSAVAFYVPEKAIANSTTGTIYVSMYVPGESATRSAVATTTVKMVYSPSEDIVDLAPRALMSGSDTNNPGGLLFNGEALRGSKAMLLGTQTKTFAAGDANGVYYTFAIKQAGYYAIQNIDTVERGTWSGIFFDYEKPVIRENNSEYVSHKVGDPNAYAYYGADAWFYLATTATAGNVGPGHYMVSSNIIKNKTTGEMVNGESKDISAVIATRLGNDVNRTILLDVADKENYALDGMITRLGAVSDTYRNNYTADWYPIRPDRNQRQPQIAGAAATQNGGWAFTLDADAFAEHEAIYVTFEDTLRTDNPPEPFTYHARLYSGWYLSHQTTDYTATEIKLIKEVDIENVENNQAVYVTFKITAPGTYTYNARTGVDRPNMTAIYFDYEEPNLEATRNVVVEDDGGASVDVGDNVITVGEDAETIIVAAKDGYKLSTITVAGQTVEITDPDAMVVTLPVVTASLKGALNIAVTTEKVTVAEIESCLLVNGTLYVTASTLAEADEFGIEWNDTKYKAEKKGNFFYTAIDNKDAWSALGEITITFRPYMTVDGDTLYGADVTETLEKSDGKTHRPDVFGNVYFGDYTDADEVPHESTLFIIGEINGVVFGSAEIVEVGVTFSLWDGTNGTEKVITRVLDVDQDKLADYTISDKNFGFAILNMDTAYSVSSFKVFIKYADETVVKSAAYDIKYVDGTYAISQAD